MNIKVIAIGASTGGTEAILDILKKLPDGLPPIVITQHMPAGFTAMYAQRLDKACVMKVKEAKDGDHLERGLALVAPGGMRLKLTGNSSGLSVRVWPGKRLHGVAPAVDELFHSAAKLAGSSAVGIILTGMGQDGASGLLEMRRRGATPLVRIKPPASYMACLWSLMKWELCVSRLRFPEFPPY